MRKNKTSLSTEIIMFKGKFLTEMTKKELIEALKWSLEQYYTLVGRVRNLELQNEVDSLNKYCPGRH